MFLKKYVSELYYNLILDNYNVSFLKTLEEENFAQIYQLLNDLGFYYTDDIILNYLEIFTYDINYINEQLKILKQKLGFNYIYIIGQNMSYLENI